MKRLRLSVLAIMALCMAVALPAPASALDIGECKVLSLNLRNGWENEALDLLQVPYTFVSPEEFLTIDLMNFDVLYVGSTFRNGSVTIVSQDALDALNDRADDIADFVHYGGGVVALSEPIGQGKYTWVPSPVQTVGGLHANVVNIANTGHPVNDGLSSQLLSYWGSSFHNSFSYHDPSLEVLATAYGYPVTLAGMFGGGKMFLTGQDADFHRWHYGARTLLGNALTWTCEKTVIMVDIDIKPGSDPNSININSRGVIPVAILTTEEFDAAEVDPGTVLFGPLGAYPENYALEDVDYDGDIDMVLHFRTQDAGIAPEDTEAVLTGETYEGRKIEGYDSVRVLERKGGRK